LSCGEGIADRHDTIAPNHPTDQRTICTPTTVIILNEKEKVAVALVGSKSFVKQKRYLLSFAVKPRREFSRTSEEADIAVSRV